MATTSVANLGQLETLSVRADRQLEKMGKLELAAKTGRPAGAIALDRRLD